MDIFLSSHTLQSSTRENIASILEKKHESSRVLTFLKRFFQKKSTIYACVIAVSLCILPTETTFAQTTETKTFIATAYYSPLPNQENYYRGSYEADKRLNGEGKVASDGTPVFMGMIAAPKNYAFGTKIALDGLGVVSVHDRGGAITANGTYDRIDIWMGYGDEGLKRTIAWGRREITGKIVNSHTPVSLNFENIVQKVPTVNDVAMKKFQAIGRDTSKNFKEIVIDFQVEYGIIPSRNDEAAGSFGPKTRAKLDELYNEFLKNGAIVSKKSETIVTKTETPIASQNIENIVTFTENMSTEQARALAQHMHIAHIGEYSENVLSLQTFLSKMGIYTDEVHGIMTLETLAAIRKYQYNYNIPQTGRVDVTTQQFIIRDLLK